ncbi:hypothetical protein [uncultured Caulobacter sp.]|jgi:EF hand|uniref:hypothetical protein n=1 Tax=uncultured Caulobacter sp. TaxID=158749 RepID=UPI00261A6180|nr:hypothetical protein [uncultured Caulobacter sp.]
MRMGLASGVALLAVTATGAAMAQALPQNLVYLDRDKDGAITQAEWTSGKPGTFKKLDLDKDGVVTREEAAKVYAEMTPADPAMAEKRTGWIMRADANGDGKVTLDELTADSVAEFKKKDRNADGVIDGHDVQG